MNFAVSIESAHGQFTATLIGAPDVKVQGPTRDAALLELRRVVLQRVHDGDIASLEIPFSSVTDHIGAFADDPSLDEISSEAYALRDSEPTE